MPDENSLSHSDFWSPLAPPHHRLMKSISMDSIRSLLKMLKNKEVQCDISFLWSFGFKIIHRGAHTHTKKAGVSATICVNLKSKILLIFYN
jgi:hypothetical protein